MADVHPARNGDHYERLSAYHALQRLAFCWSRQSESVLVNPTEPTADPLTVDEVITCLRDRWKATYDLQLAVRRQRLYLHVMWAYLEQQSFPMDENAYRVHLAEVLDVVNRLGLAGAVPADAVVVKSAVCAVCTAGAAGAVPAEAIVLNSAA